MDIPTDEEKMKYPSHAYIVDTLKSLKNICDLDQRTFDFTCSLLVFLPKLAYCNLMVVATLETKSNGFYSKKGGKKWKVV